MSLLWNKRSYTLITGASRGIGREIAVTFAAKFAPDSLMVLVARSQLDLEETKKLVLAKNPLIQVQTHCVDLATPNDKELKSLVKNSVTNSSDFEYAVLVHNAGSLGDVAKGAANLSSTSELQEYFTFNVFSMIVLNSAFLDVFPATICPRLIINITSLCAIKPMCNFALYCSGKATREMLLNVVALEDPSVQVLHYSPGPVLTAMADEILDKVPPTETRAVFEKMRENGGYLTTEQTIQRLVEVLDRAKFKSGDHVDYFD